MKYKRFMLLVCLVAFVVMGSEVMAENGACDINKIISENQRVNELEGQRTREYFDATADTILVEVEKQGWDWLGAVKLFVTEQVKKLVLTFAISIFGAIMVINGMTGIIFLRLQRNKFVLMNEEISKLAKLCEPKKEDEPDTKKSKTKKGTNGKTDTPEMNNIAMDRAMEKIYERLYDLVTTKMEERIDKGEIGKPSESKKERVMQELVRRNESVKSKGEIIMPELVRPEESVKPEAIVIPEKKKTGFRLFGRKKKPKDSKKDGVTLRWE